LRDAVSEVALDRNAALLRVERTHLTEEMERQRETMSTLEQGQVAVASLKALREHMCDRLDSATLEDRRTVLEIRVMVGVGGTLEVSIGIPQQVADCVQRTHGQ
jgi:DNA-binding Xre family transcriptional regulator